MFVLGALEPIAANLVTPIGEIERPGGNLKRAVLSTTKGRERYFLSLAAILRRVNVK